MFIPKNHRILFVDDDPNRHTVFMNCMKDRIKHIKQTWGFHETIDVLENNVFDTIFLDHDLGDHRKGDRLYEMYSNREFTGADIARWIIANTNAIPQQCVVHSVNPSGAQNITNIMRKVCAVEVCPFPVLFTVIK